MMKRLSYSQRAQRMENPLAKYLLQLMEVKQTNLAIAADVTTADELLTLADKLGPEICVFKTHIDIITDFSPALTQQLQQLAKQHEFLLFEDRKFADIGNTVMHQYRDGIYHIAQWADIINAHSLPGPGIIAGLKTVGQPLNRGCLLLAEMSSSGALFSKDYIEATITMATQHPEFVMGFIAQRRLTDEQDFIYMTPGVNFQVEGDNLGQQYNDPTTVIKDNGSDIIIVGRAIIKANDPAMIAKEFRQAGWQAYQAALSM
jgi:orotidine 5'-phosphate decarboxylase subfamily 1